MRPKNQRNIRFTFRPAKSRNIISQSLTEIAEGDKKLKTFCGLALYSEFTTYPKNPAGSVNPGVPREIFLRLLKKDDIFSRLCSFYFRAWDSADGNRDCCLRLC